MDFGSQPNNPLIPKFEACTVFLAKYNRVGPRCTLLRRERDRERERSYRKGKAKTE
jgi:hypothetical protein